VSACAPRCATKHDPQRLDRFDRARKEHGDEQSPALHAALLYSRSARQCPADCRQRQLRAEPRGESPQRPRRTTPITAATPHSISSSGMPRRSPSTTSDDNPWTADQAAYSAPGRRSGGSAPTATSSSGRAVSIVYGLG